MELGGNFERYFGKICRLQKVPVREIDSILENSTVEINLREISVLTIVHIIVGRKPSLHVPLSVLLGSHVESRPALKLGRHEKHTIVEGCKIETGRAESGS